jgi:hypothetical protein
MNVQRSGLLLRQVRFLHGSEVALDATSTADADLDAVLGGHAAGGVKWPAFGEGGARSVERLEVSLDARLVQKVDHRAIEGGAEQIGADPPVLGHIGRRAARAGPSGRCALPAPAPKTRRRAGSGITQFDDSADDRRLLDPWASHARVVSEVSSVLHRTRRAVLPEVDALTEPIEIVAAAFEMGTARKDPFRYGGITAVESQCVGREDRVHAAQGTRQRYRLAS